MIMSPPNDAPPRQDWVERTEALVLRASIPLVAQAGWTWSLVWAAGAEVGLSRAESELLLPGGPRDLAELFAKRLEQATLASLVHYDPTQMKVRERIAAGVEAWLDALESEDSASRRWTGFLALPSNLSLGLRLAWETADVVWRWAGDAAVDENHYTKRLLLAEILISSGAICLTLGPGAARRHAQRRIQGVMAFEAWKRRLPDASAWAAGLAARLSRLRYGAPAEI